MIIISMPKNSRNILPLLLLSNIFPLYGVVQEGWPFFLVLYIFWFEMILVTFFSLLKMFFSRAGEAGWDKARKMFSFALVRLGIFCFYMIFIVVFVGLMGTAQHQRVQIFQAMAFRDTIFNIAILNFFGYNLLEFIFYFILNKRYLSSQPGDHNQLIDGRQIVVHVVVVLGAFLSNYILQHTNNNFYYSNLALVILFILVKTIADFIGSRKPEEEPLEKYI